MMTDSELLTWAARAAGVEPLGPIDERMVNRVIGCRARTLPQYVEGESNDIWWNPLVNDADALRLAVKLKLTVMDGCARDGDGNIYLGEDDDPYAATRRAIVTAAAIIGKEMK